ncbi:hypothetical protein WA588_004149, partial [Blastocystis sp. NMH]
MESLRTSEMLPKSKKREKNPSSSTIVDPIQKRPPSNRGFYFYTDSHTNDVADYEYLVKDLTQESSVVQNELHPVMYRLFLCILLHEVKKANVYVKRKFFDAHVNRFLNETTRDEINLIQIYVFYPFSFIVSIDPLIKRIQQTVRISADSFAFLYSRVRGRSLQGIQDFFCRMIDIAMLPQVHSTKKPSVEQPTPLSKEEKDSLDQIGQFPSIAVLQLHQLFQCSSDEFPLSPTETHITCCTIGDGGNTIIVATEDAKIHVIQTNYGSSSQSSVYQQFCLIGHHAAVTAMDISRDTCYLLTCSIDGDVRLWSLQERACVFVYSFSRCPLWSIRFSHRNSRFVCGGLDARVYVCSTGEAAPWRVESYHRSSVTHCLFTSNDDYTVTCDNGGEIRLINTNTGQCERLLVTKAAVSKIEVWKDNQFIVFGTEDGFVGVYRVITGKIVFLKQLFDSMVTGMEAVGNDYIVLSDSTGVIRVYTYSPENEFIVVAEEKCGHPIHTMQRSNFNRLFAVQLD